MTRLALVALFAVACGGSEPAAPPPAKPPPAAKAPEPAPAPPAPAPEAAPEAAAGVDGKAIYDQYCVACHQADGKGMDGKMAANLIEDKTRLAKPDEELMKIVKEGKTGTVGAMPPWGSTLNDDQVTAVVGYMKTTFGGN